MAWHTLTVLKFKTFQKIILLYKQTVLKKHSSTKYKENDNVCTYNVTMSRVLAIIVAVEEK